MEYISSVFSLLFFSLIFIYLYWGIYIIQLNQKASVNKIFLILCVSLSIWSLGFGMANSAKDLETVLFWRRFSAIGWTTVYSLMLHFLLLLSNKDSPLKQRLLFCLLHIPAIISMFIFSFSNKMAVIQYNIVKIDYGWINKSVNNGWDWFFNVYYASYILLSIFIVWKWQYVLKDRKMVRQARLIVGAIFFGLILGTVTDMVVSSIFDSPLPQMAPLFILLPAWTMYHSARYYGLMKREIVSKNEIIVTDEDRKRIFKNIGIAFCIGGVLIFFAKYQPLIFDGKGNLQSELVKSGLIIGTGLGIFIIQKIRKESIREALTIIVLLLSIPIITLRLLEYSSITVWVFPILIIISSLVFSKRTLLVSATVVAIITQRLVWILRPESLVTIDQYDYMLRIWIFIVSFFIGFYVNKVYVAKIKENEYQINFQKMNSEVSFDFITISQNNFDENINQLLTKLGLFFKVDRVYLFLINHDNNTMIYSHEWCNDGIEIKVATIEEMPITTFSWWIDELERNGLVYIKDVNISFDVASSEQEQLMLQEVKSLVSLPIKGKDKIQGFIGIDSIKSPKEWLKEDIKLLNILSSLISHGLTKINAEKEIEFMAYYDHLTKLPNRFLFSDRVNQAIHLAERTGSFVSVIFIDLDNFKTVNDTLGHSSGDYLLKQVSDGLSQMVRKTDTVSRFGGDEFMIMLNNITDHNDILNIADKLMSLFIKPFNISGQEFLITSSAGISIYPIDGEDAETLIKNADTAMYRAKKKGKNQYVLCTTDMKEEVQMNMTLSNDLYRGLEKDEFIVYYQPQMDIVTGEIKGVEALLRWVHTKEGMIPPEVFIPLAENNGLINSIGEWVLRTACIQNKEWQDMGLPHLRMAVNLSVIQFINPNIVSNVENILSETGLSPKYLELEVTESIAIKEATHAEETLNKLKEIGISIAIDDFGTEYSSLNRLKILPIDRIKIDMQFTQGIENNEKDRAITMVIIDLAKSLGLNVLAEGVETREQMEFLNQRLCDEVQGYYYHKPMPAKEIEKLLLSLKSIREQKCSLNSQE